MFNEDFNFAGHLSKAAAWTGMVEVSLLCASSWAESSCAVHAALISLACLFFCLLGLLLVWENKSLDIPRSSKFRWSYLRTSLAIAATLSDSVSASVCLGLERDATFAFSLLGSLQIWNCTTRPLTGTDCVKESLVIISQAPK